MYKVASKSWCREWKWFNIWLRRFFWPHWEFMVSLKGYWWPWVHLGVGISFGPLGIQIDYYTRDKGERIRNVAISKS